MEKMALQKHVAWFKREFSEITVQICSGFMGSCYMRNYDELDKFREMLSEK